MPTWAGSQRSMPTRASSTELTAAPPVGYPRTVSCLGGGFWGSNIHDRGHADTGPSERVRVPLADGTLVPVPGGRPDPAMIPSLRTLSDVMCTGHPRRPRRLGEHGCTVAVVGDGAVGLCAIIVAKRLGAAHGSGPTTRCARMADRPPRTHNFDAGPLICQQLPDLLAGPSARSGRPIGTPWRQCAACQYWARIGHGSGLINFSRARFVAHEVVPDKALRHIALR